MENSASVWKKFGQKLENIFCREKSAKIPANEPPGRRREKIIENLRQKRSSKKKQTQFDKQKEMQ